MLGELAALRALEGGGVDVLVQPVTAAGDVPTYESVIVTRIDSGLHDLASLRGRTIALVDEQSASGYLAPRALLREAGIEPDALTVRLLGSHRAVAEAVIAGDAEAGAMHAGTLSPPSLDRGPDYARLREIARSRPIPRGPIAVRTDLPARDRTALASALLRVHEVDPAAAAVLNVRGGQHFSLAARPTSRLPTLKSVASLAGVSYATVSRVVNRSGYVAPETARRIAAIVEELGYRPNGNALTLHGQRTPLVGLVITHPNAPGVDALTSQLRAGFAAASVPLVLCPAGDSLADSPFPDLLLDGRLGALIVTAAHANDPILAQLTRTGRTVLAISPSHPTREFTRHAEIPGLLTAPPATAAQTLLSALRSTSGSVANSVRQAALSALAGLPSSAVSCGA